MSMTDPIADLLTRIRNAHTVKHDRLDLPASKLKAEVCRILKEQGYIEDVEPIEVDGPGSGLRVYLRYTDEGIPAIRRIARVSKPGRRVYKGADDIRPVLNGVGVGIISTSQGLLSDADARERRLGGEVICEVW